MRFKGELNLESGHTLKLNFNSLADLEDLTGEPAMKTFAKFETGDVSFKDIRNLFYVCLKQNHPDVTLEEAGDLADFETINQLFAVAMPKSESGNGRKTKTDK